MQRLLRTFGALPLPLNHALGAAIGSLLGLFARRARAVTRINLKLCLPELSAGERRAIAGRSLIESGKAIAELGWFWHQPAERVLDKIVRVEGIERLDQALALGNGVLLAAPHLGAWEILCLYLSSRADSAILYREPNDSGVADVITQGRQRLGADLIKADAQGVRALFRAARANKIIGILPDQQPKKGTGEFADFFGVPALTMVLYSRLAQKTRCALITAWAERLPGGKGYVLHFADGDTAIRDDDLSQSTNALNRAIETEVRRCPEQYQWSYKRFNLQPDGNSPYLGTP